MIGTLASRDDVVRPFVGEARCAQILRGIRSSKLMLAVASGETSKPDRTLSARDLLGSRLNDGVLVVDWHQEDRIDVEWEGARVSAVTLYRHKDDARAIGR